MTTQMLRNDILSEVNQAQDTLADTEQQLSSGKRINEPSDDPYGASLAVELNGQLSSLSDYSNNITDATAWTQTASSAISSIQNEVQRAQELVTQAANGTNSQDDLNDLAAEIKQVVQSVKSSANTQYNGQYIFSGSAMTTAPYSTDYGTDTYNGNTSSITRQIGPATSVTVNGNLSSILGQGSASADGGLLDTLETAYNDMESGDTTALGSTDLDNLQANLSSLTTLQTTIGATQNQISLASSTISSMQTSLTSELSNDQDVNMASALTSYSSEQAALTAALKAGANIVQTSLMDFLSTS